MRVKFYTFFIGILLSGLSVVQAQRSAADRTLPGFPEEPQRCYATEMHELNYAVNEAYRTWYNERQPKIEAIKDLAAQQARLNCNDPIIIPVAVHYEGVTSQSLTCLRNLALSQIQVLNEDFSASNADIDNYCDDTENSDLDPLALAANGACIQFCLADQNHPAGFGLNNGDYAITINQNYVANGSFPNFTNGVWAGYLNIFVTEGTGVLGYAPLFGSANGDGVVIEACVFGKTGSGCGNGVGPGGGCGGYNAYNLGRTATHEIGHYLGLGHIWGNGCGVDDGFADTPNSAQEYFGCPAQGSASCGTDDMYMNFMDYTNDACMYMFSELQAVRMHTTADNLWNTTSPKCSSTPAYPSQTLPGGCNPDALVPSFTANPASGCEGTTVAFTNTSTGAITTYSWDFDNGNTSTAQNPPAQTYNTAGTYTVTLTIGDGSGFESYDMDIIIGETGEFNHLNGGALTQLLATAYGGTSGYISGTNSFDDRAKAEYFEEGVAGATLGDVDFYFFRANTNAANVTFRVWDAGASGPSTVLATKSVPKASISTTGVTTVNFGTVTLNGPFYVGFELTGNAGEDIVIKTNSDGQTIPATAWEKWTDGTWYPFNDYTNSNTTWEADLALAVYANIECPVVAPEPVANFSADATTVCQGTTVSFTDLTTNNPTSWAWTFGDGGTSNLQNPTHTYNTAGNFTVTLTATNGEGSDTETKTDYIHVQAAPVGFTAVANPTTICAGQSVSLSMTGTFGGAYSWQPGNLTGMNQTVSPTSTTTYTAICDDGVCEATSDVTVTVNQNPSTPTINVNGANLTASSSSSGNWQWNLNGSPIGGATSSTYTATVNGSYTVTLTNPSTGCSSTSAAQNVVLPSPPSAAFTASSTTVCEDDAVQFTDQTTGIPTSWSWTFGDGGTSDQQNPTHTYTSFGTYTVTLVATNGQGSDTETKTNYITVQAAPTGFAATVTDNEICAGESTTLGVVNGFGTYTWTPGNLTGASVNVSPSSTTTYNVVCDNGVCEASSSVSVTVNNLPSTPVISNTLNVLTATSSSTGDWQWFLNGSSISGATSASYTPAANGNYTVSLTDGNGCTSTSSVYNLTTVGVFDQALDMAFGLYPNPTSGAVNVNFSGIDIKNLHLELIDVAGKTLLSVPVVNESSVLDLSRLNSGMYFIKAIGEDGGFAVRELIKF